MPDRLKQQIARAEHVNNLLNDPVLTDAWAKVETDILAMWRNSKSEDEGGREELYRELHGLKAVRARLERTIKAGKLAEAELEHQKHGD